MLFILKSLIKIIKLKIVANYVVNLLKIVLMKQGVNFVIIFFMKQSFVINVHYEKEKEFFCYCYQAQRKSYWCNKYFTNDVQKKIIPYMVEYFILQLTTIAFEKQYEENKDKSIHRKTFLSIFVISFFLFFYFTLSLTKFIKEENDEISKDDNEEEKIKKSKNKEIISKLSNEILDGIHGIVLFNSIFSIVFSSFYLSEKFEYHEFFFINNINYIFIPILLNKFFFLTLNYYCIYTSEEKKNKDFEIISASTLISIYMNVWDLIISFIKNIIPKENNIILFIIQIICSSLPALLLVLLILFAFCRSLYVCHLFNLCCCFISFFLCFGGLWIKLDDNCKLEFEGCNCQICDCDIIGSTIFLNSCCCDKDSCCYNKYCDDHCQDLQICCDYEEIFCCWC